jgi:hypothetical protein
MMKVAVAAVVVLLALYLPGSLGAQASPCVNIVGYSDMVGVKCDGQYVDQVEKRVGDITKLNLYFDGTCVTGVKVRQQAPSSGSSMAAAVQYHTIKSTSGDCAIYDPALSKSAMLLLASLPPAGWIVHGMHGAAYIIMDNNTSTYNTHTACSMYRSSCFVDLMSSMSCKLERGRKQESHQ